MLVAEGGGGGEGLDPHPSRAPRGAQILLVLMALATDDSGETLQLDKWREDGRDPAAEVEAEPHDQKECSTLPVVHLLFLTRLLPRRSLHLMLL